MEFKISSGEQILWQGRPEFKPYLKSGFIEFLKTFGFFVFVWTVFLTLSKIGKYELNWIVMYLIALSILGSGLYQLLKKIIAYRKIVYFITNLRVVIKNGDAVGNTVSLEKSKIAFLDLDVSKTERRFNVGTILINLGEVKENYDGQEYKVIYRLESVREPNSILRLF